MAITQFRPDFAIEGPDEADNYSVAMDGIPIFSGLPDREGAEYVQFHLDQAVRTLSLIMADFEQFRTEDVISVPFRF